MELLIAVGVTSLIEAFVYPAHSFEGFCLAYVWATTMAWAATIILIDERERAKTSQR